MSDNERLTKHDRENLIFKLEKEFAFAGATIPREIEADGPIKLRQFIFETAKKRGRLTPEEMAEVDLIANRLRKKRREIVMRIAHEDLTGAEAKELFGTAIGIDRALDTLYSAQLPASSLREESRKARLEDGRRWLNMVKRVYTRDDRRKLDQE
jgi:hypothetical protein